MKIDEIERNPKGYRGRLLTNIIAAVKECRPLLTPHMRYQFTPDGYIAQAIVRRGVGPWVPARMFDMANIGPTTFSIKSNRARTEGGWFRTVKKTIGDGAGMTWNAATDSWDATAIEATSWVYTKRVRDTVAITLEVGTSIPDGDNNTIIKPKWYITWDTDHIDWSLAVDMRDADYESNMV